MLWLVFGVAVVLLVVRSRVKRRRRPSTGADVLAAARVQGEFPHYDVRPHRVDPVSGARDWGQ